MLLKSINSKKIRILFLPFSNKFICLFIFSILFSIKLFSQSSNKLISQYVQQKWSVENGLPHNSITSITQTKDRYLWFGSKIGLIRFDGINFTLFDKKSHPEIDLSDIWSLESDKYGNLWIGTNAGGLIKYSNDQFTSYTVEDGLADNSVWSLSADDSTLWIGTGGGGISIFNNGKFKTINETNGLSSNYIWCIIKDLKGNFWAGTDGSFLNVIKNDGLSYYDMFNGFPGDYVMTAYAAENGDLWFGAAGVGLIKYSKNVFKIYNEKDGLINNVIWSIIEDSKKNIWVGTDEGLVKISNGKFDTFNENHGLPNSIVSAVYEDLEGNIWIATKGGGVVKFRDPPLTAYTTKQGLPHNNIFSILEDKSADLWLGTSRGLSKYNNGKFINYHYPEGLTSDNILSLWESEDGKLWLGTDGGGLYSFSDRKFKNFFYESGFPANTVRCIVEDKKGILWMGTDGQGIVNYNGENFSLFNMDMGLSSEFIGAIIEDHNGFIWAGSRDGSGLNKIDNNIVEVFKTDDGLLSNDIYSLFEDKEKYLWIGTDRGLNRIKNNKIFKYTGKDGLFSENIFSINEDDNGNLWMSSSNGIFSVAKKDFDDFDRKKINKITGIFYGISDGMKSSECNTGSPGSFKTKKGEIWFPTIQGAVVVNPAQIEKNKIVPEIKINKIIINEKLYPVKKIQTAPPGNTNLEIHFSALSFSVPQKVQYKYKLEGFDKDWVDGDNNSTAKYSHLSPGNYKFTVIASNNDGVWNKTGAAISIKLKPYYYQTYWFYALCLAGLYILFAAVIKIRTKKLKENEQYLISKVEERTAELLEENRFRKKAEDEIRTSLEEKEKLLVEKTGLLKEKEVLLKEIHHRVKNNLQVISSLLYLNSKKIKDEEAYNLFKDSQNRVKSIALVHERLYRSHDLSKIDFKEYIQLLIKDLFVSYAVDNSKIKLELDINNIFIDIDFAVPLGLVINEIISNSLKYAFTDFEKAGKNGIISITFSRCVDDRFVLQVSDNGKGFPEEIQKKKKDSLGLLLVETLVNQLEGTLAINNSNGTSFEISFKQNK